MYWLRSGDVVRPKGRLRTGACSVGPVSYQLAVKHQNNLATNCTNFTKAGLPASYPKRIGAFRQIRVIRVQEIPGSKFTQRNTSRDPGNRGTRDPGHHAPRLVMVMASGLSTQT